MRRLPAPLAIAFFALKTMPSHSFVPAAYQQFSPAALVTARDIVDCVRISRAHLYKKVSEGKFPAPAIKDGPRYTRWKWVDVMDYLADPQAWVDRTSAEALSGVEA
jgi:predicted DNA-binding transcriptional regulator AlpA